MPFVTGTLSDFGLATIPNLSPVVVFEAESAGIDYGRVLITKPVEAIPDALGGFRVRLHSLATVEPPMGYRVSVKWLNGDGVPVGFDEIPGRLYVGDEDVLFGDAFVPDTSGAVRVWVGLTPPSNPAPGTWWLVQDPANPLDPGDPPAGRKLNELLKWS